MKTDPQSYDFFVSYARPDNTDGWITDFVDKLVTLLLSGRDLNSTPDRFPTFNSTILWDDCEL